MPTVQTSLNQIKADRPPVHIKKDGEARCIGLHSDALQCLFEQLTQGMHSLETGCGLSTLVFALAQCQHIAIVPNNNHIKSTCESAAKYDVDLHLVKFIEERSELILPKLYFDKPLDVVLIDGGHAFPIPIIDWFYTNLHLSVKGLLVLDDIHLKTVNVLYEFLKKQPEWELKNIIHKTAFFQKSENTHDNASPWDYWRSQPFNSDSKVIVNRAKNYFRDKLRF